MRCLFKSKEVFPKENTSLGEVVGKGFAGEGTDEDEVLERERFTKELNELQNYIKGNLQEVLYISTEGTTEGEYFLTQEVLKSLVSRLEEPLGTMYSSVGEEIYNVYLNSEGVCPIGKERVYIIDISIPGMSDYLLIRTRTPK